MMFLEIDKEVTQKTTACEKNFACLTNYFHNFCKVESTIQGNVHFVKCPEGLKCNYKLCFAKERICTCPTRKELFRKYGI